MKILHSVHPDDFKTYQTATIRERFLLSDLVNADVATFVYAHDDRMITGIINPVNKSVNLDSYPELRAGFFLERREIGIINVGGTGTVTADGKRFTLDKMDCVYLGKGVKNVSFGSVNKQSPAIFYALSTPAHQNHPTTFLKHADAFSARMGSTETANDRKIVRYIHKDGIQSCQLVMGLTILSSGSVWNTIPPHVHDRRMEVYFYFDIDADQRIFHYMGEASETRHILMANHEAVISPPWSIHAGSGTKNYSFIWGMGGENLDYADMDSIPVTDIR